MTVVVVIDPKAIAKLKAAILGVATDLRKELRIAVNKTATKAKAIISKEIRTELVQNASDVNWMIKVDRGATDLDLTAEVIVKKTDRLGLRHFGAKQIKKGVSYRISKSGKRKSIPGAFIVAKWKGHVFVRTGAGRLPIEKRWGPSAWGVFVVGKKNKSSVEISEAELLKQINERIRFLNLKKAGII